MIFQELRDLRNPCFCVVCYPIADELIVVSGNDTDLGALGALAIDKAFKKSMFLYCLLPYCR